MRVKVPFQSMKYTTEVTGLPSLLPVYRQRIIKSNVKMQVPIHPM